MFEVINQSNVSVASHQVWQVLNNLPGYCDWHPTVFFRGTAANNGVAEYGYNGTIASMREPSVPARILSYDPGTLIGWRIGIPAVMWIDEWYRLTAIKSGTHVEHGMRFSGPLSWVTKPFANRRIRSSLGTADAALAMKMRAAPQICPHCNRIHPRQVRRQQRKPR